jgi:hypothetical protein
MIRTPPIPAVCISSRFWVIPCLVTELPIHHQKVQGFDSLAKLLFELLSNRKEGRRINKRVMLYNIYFFILNARFEKECCSIQLE